LASSITSDTKENAFVVQHADLILKCVWKRSRSAEEDFKTGLLDAGDMLRVIEAFLVEIPPKDWRQRAVDQVPIGDMPLRTIKVLIQHIVCKLSS
jgi:cytoskeleton-associated protein 5